MAALLIVLFTVAAVVFGSLLNGFALSILWRWFAVPLGLPEIGVAWAVGLAVLAGMLTKDCAPVPDDKKVEALTWAFARPLLALLVGWVALQFMP